MTRGVWSWFLPAVVIAPSLTINAADSATTALESFAILCQEPGDLEVEAVFAPINERESDQADRRLTPRQPCAAGEGTWSWEFANDQRRYPDGRFVVSDQATEVHFVSILKAEKDDTIPPFLWHLISVPAKTADQCAVRPAAYVPPDSYWSRDQLAVLTQSVHQTDRGRTYLTFHKAGNSTAAHKITDLWSSTFPLPMDRLVKPSLQGTASICHYHTFRHVPTPTKASLIGPCGDRQNSSKVVQLPGRAYGFVLDNKARCLAFATLQLVPKDDQTTR